VCRSLVINTLVGLLLGSMAYYVALLYTGAVAVVFMANTLQHGISVSHHEHANPKRNYLLIGWVPNRPFAVSGSICDVSAVFVLHGLRVSCLQFVLIWWLGYSGDM
jgi:hypothetical protein